MSVIISIIIIMINSHYYKCYIFASSSLSVPYSGIIPVVQHSVVGVVAKFVVVVAAAAVAKLAPAVSLFLPVFSWNKIKRNFKKKLLVQVDQRVTTIHWTNNSTGPFQNYIIPFVCPPKFCTTLFPFSPGTYNGSKSKIKTLLKFLTLFHL